MKTRAELICDLKSALDPMDALAIHELATLLGVLTAGPDAESAMDGINRIITDIRGHAGSLRRLHDEAAQIAHRLANP